MKRNLYPNSEDQSKMSKNENSEEIRFLIPSRAAGAIIGKGGENIKDIRERLDIRVSIPDSNGPERCVILQGQSASLIETLEIILNKSISYMPASESDLYNDRGHPRRRFKSREEGGDSMSGESEGIDFRLLIHQSQAGSIIGRGGERIKELRDTATIKTLKVYQSMCPRSSDRVVQIVGTVNAVLMCVEKIIEILNSSNTKDMVGGSEEQYNPRNFVESQALSYGGWLSKTAMRLLEESGPQGLVNMLPPTQALHHQTTDGIVGGTSSGNSKGMAGVLGRMAAAGGGGGQRPFADPVLPGGVVKTVQFSVPNAYMGAIMGRGGNKIRAIREESQAEIRVYEPDKSGGDRIIDITGTDHQIGFAQQLLKNSVKRQ